MVIHTIVFAVLSALSAIAIYAIGKPISKSPPAQQTPGSDEASDATSGESAPL
jgi:Na+-transporting methylmalonyl-CoA/oxaloacetate decarboxylase gamma subunit